MLTVNDKEFIWEQKFRPGTVDECILPAADKKILKRIAKDKQIPNMIIHSPSPGTGKTTVAKALVNEIDAEFMFVNGADALLPFIRSVIAPFAQTKTTAPGGKVVIIDEFDRPNLVESHKYMRSFMEAVSHNCTFIFTANNVEGMHEALRSRCRVIEFGKVGDADTIPMMKQMIHRSMEILKHENIPVEDPKVIAALVKSNFPDFRKTTNTLDYYAKNGKIDSGILSVVLNSGDVKDVVTAIKDKNMRELRSLAIKYSGDYQNMISKLYSELYQVVSPSSVIRMIEIIGENNQYFGLAANPEIHIMFLYTNLLTELNFK